MMHHILVVGAGYVGLAHALLFAKQGKHHVTIADQDQKKIGLLQSGISPLAEADIAQLLARKLTNLSAIHSSAICYTDYDIIFLCLPTNYDEEAEQFDTRIMDWYIRDISRQVQEIPVIIKSTLPIGYTQHQIDEHNYPHLIFSPEFLREGQALQDNLYPSRLIFGTVLSNIEPIYQLYSQAIADKNTPILTMTPTEAESVKLFSNTYLAMRVAFFNELDTFSAVHQLSSSAIIKGVGLDPRIGRYYNNPSFGYGGYCLPKDSKQLKAQFADLPNDLIGAIVTSNDRRKHFIAQHILNKGARRIGIYRLSMKHSSDNSRESAILEIMHLLQEAGCELIVYEPELLTEQLPPSIAHTVDRDRFFSETELILANRWHDELESVKEKVYTRDIFQMD